jgi:histidine triad (HIT) family protein
VTCAFCQIVDGKDHRAREVCRDRHTVAFLPLEPATLGHTLLVPRQHISEIWDLDKETAGHLAQATLSVAQAVRRAFSPDGLNIIQSNGEAASQTIPHLHIHIVPRWMDDRMGKLWPEGSPFSEDAQDSAWQLLLRECKRTEST